MASEPLEMFRHLALALRVARGLQDCSQAELARRTRMGKSQVSLYENGKRLPTLPGLARLLRELKMTPYLFFYTLHVLDELKAGRATPVPLAEEVSVLTPNERAAFSRLADDLLALQRAFIEARIGSLPNSVGR